MRRFFASVFLLVLLSSLLLATDSNLSKLSNFAKLTNSQKETFIKFIKSANCYYGCDDTIWQCLTQNSRAAKRIAEFLIRRLLEGTDEQGLQKALIHRAASAFPAKQYNISISGLTPSGIPNAPVKVVIYADFKCPYCRVASPALRRISQEMPDKVVVYFKQFPVKSHGKLAITAAIAAVAADKQGKFWCMHDALFKLANEDKLNSVDDILSAAKTCELNIEQLKADMKNKDIINRVRNEKREGMALGVIGTPGIFVNGKYYSGIKTYAELKDRIEEELEILSGVE